jgi:hydroxymethylpyrimidine kinase / phosphomethylpyrimidine kinase / thiamine-phosphate diphosphorylase
VLSIAGYDPSGGAGVLADVKTCEALGATGLAVITANTWQNENEFRELNWMETQAIIRQIDVLASGYPITHVKIGLVSGLEGLKTIIEYLLLLNPSCTIVWDPVLKASAGFHFHGNLQGRLLDSILQRITLLTPNIPELLSLTGMKDPEAAAKSLSDHCSLLVKGGHASGNDSTDVLYYQSSTREPLSFEAGRIPGEGKHGSGCVLSAAIATSLAQGLSMEASVLKAKDYVTAFLRSSDTRLGRHEYSLLAVSRLHFITADLENLSHTAQAEKACRGGVDWVQLRVKNMPFGDWLQTACEVKEICDYYGARLIVNDSVIIAKESGAYGVHLGRQDMRPEEARRLLGSRFCIGGTANTVSDIDDLCAQGVDYIGLGPFRPTNTKKNLSPILGREGMTAALEHCRQRGIQIPVISIGGLTAADLPEIKSTGCYGAAVSSAISQATSPEKAAFTLVKSTFDTWRKTGEINETTEIQHGTFTDRQ